MNDKDKEAFDEWLSEAGNHYADALAYEFEKHLCFVSWQAACNYKRDEYSNLMKAMTQTSQNNFKLQAENKKLREALIECPIVGEIYRDSNERFKEWNLIHRNTLRELKAGE
jgi:hypothetical protein